eukprot:scaffold429_cov269-Pinguiococcus_pyrenoidosus.AAC.11
MARQGRAGQSNPVQSGKGPKGPKEQKEQKEQKGRKGPKEPKGQEKGRRHKPKLSRTCIVDSPHEDRPKSERRRLDCTPPARAACRLCPPGHRRLRHCAPDRWMPCTQEQLRGQTLGLWARYEGRTPSADRYEGFGVSCEGGPSLSQGSLAYAGLDSSSGKGSSDACDCCLSSTTSRPSEAADPST